jgi:hypothetical protein
MFIQMIAIRKIVQTTGIDLRSLAGTRKYIAQPPEMARARREVWWGLSSGMHSIRQYHLETGGRNGDIMTAVKTECL